VDHSAVDVVLLIVAGLAAGVVNALAGGGSLLTFPALIAVGLPAVDANVTNSLAVFPGYAASVYGSRSDLAGQRAWIVRLVPVALAGSLVGCVLLLVTPASAFEVIAPFLVLGATAVLAFKARLQRIVGHPAELSGRRRGATMLGLTALGSVYGGYFGAALGVIFVAVLALVLDEPMRRISALKNVLSATAGAVTVVVFALFGPVSWLGVLIIAPATMVGGYLGSLLARRLPGQVLQWIIVVFGLVIGAALLVRALT
jgi:uncharacterized membrane protein YfcA